MPHNKRLLASALPIALLAAFAALDTTAQDSNLLKDAGFENETPGSEGGWRLFGPSQLSDEHAKSGTKSMFNGGSSRSVSYTPHFVGSVSGSYQEFAATPGSRWRLTGYGMLVDPLEGTPAFGIVQVSFFDENGKDLGTVETGNINPPRAKLSNEINNQSPTGEWIALDTGVATAPDGAATVQAFTLFVDYSGSNIFQGVHFDDLEFCALAEGSDTDCK